MNLLEKIGWVSGIVASVTSQGFLILGGSHPTLKWLIFLGGLGILGITGIFHLKSSKSQKDSEAIQQNNIFDKQAYSDHIKDLFSFAEPVRSNTDPQYIQSVHKITNIGQKKMILQHFSTHQLVSNKSSPLYTVYRATIGGHNELKNDRQKITRNLILLKENIRNMGFIGSNSENWIQIKDFENAFGLYSTDFLPLYENLLKFRYYAFEHLLTEQFPIDWDEKNNEWRIGYENNKFAGSKSNEKLVELGNLIMDKGKELNDSINKLNGRLNVLQRFAEPNFNYEFSQMYEPSRNGNPIIGACDGCVEYFVGNDKKKYKTILENFNSDISNWEESSWRNRDFLDDDYESN